MTATMVQLVDTLIEDSRWASIDLADLAETAAVETLCDQALAPAKFEISLLGCNDRRIADLNADYRGKPVPTNVLSWPAAEHGAEHDGARPYKPDAGKVDKPAELGDIALAWETCAREAAERGIDMRDHVTHLLVHGVLHLLGYDHVRDKDAALMEATELRILAGLGIANPYE